MAGSSRGPRGMKRASCLGGGGSSGRGMMRERSVMPCEDTIVANGVGTGRWNQGAQPSEEGVRGHLSVGGPTAGGLLEVHANQTVCSALDGVVGKRRAQQVSTQPFETTAVATVHGDRGMQLHAEGGDEQGRSRRGLTGRRGCSAKGQSELNAGGHGRIDLVVTLVIMAGLERSEVGMHALQRASEVLIGQLSKSPEARFVRLRGVEAAVGHERMQMHEEPQVVAEALHHDEHARVQGSAALQAVRALGEPSQRLHDPGGETPAHRAEQCPVISEPQRYRPGKREHPLPPRHGGQAMLHQQSSGLGHPPPHTRRADAAALAGERNPEAVTAALTLRDEEAVLEVAAGDECVEFITDERRQGARALFEAVAKRRPVFPNEGEDVTILGAARDALRSGMTTGHRWPRCVSRARRSPVSLRALGRRCGGSTGPPMAHRWASARATGRPTPSPGSAHPTAPSRAGESRSFRGPSPRGESRCTIDAAESSITSRGTRERITVLFSDIRGFTAFSETVEPEEVVDMLKRVTSRSTGRPGSGRGCRVTRPPRRRRPWDATA